MRLGRPPRACVLHGTAPRLAGRCTAVGHPGGHAGAAFASSESPNLKAPDSDASAAQWPTVGCCRAARPQREEQGDLFFLFRPLGIISWRPWPCPRVRPRRHVPSGHARRYSSCHWSFTRQTLATWPEAGVNHVDSDSVALVCSTKPPPLNLLNSLKTHGVLVWYGVPGSKCGLWN